MDRRTFLSAAGGAMMGTMAGPGLLLGGETTSTGLSWRRHKGSGLFDRVTVRGRPFLWPEEKVGLLDGFARLLEPGPETLLNVSGADQRCGPVQLRLSHRLRCSKGGPTEDLLNAVLELKNTSDIPQELVAGFRTGVRPCPHIADQQVHVALSAAGLRDAENDPRGRLKDCWQAVGSTPFVAHYLEPQASDPRHTATRAALLVPVVDVFAEGTPCRVAFFTPSTEPVCFEAQQGASSRAWQISRRIRLRPGGCQTLRAFLFLHPGGVDEAWRVFHQFGHQEDFPPVEWPRSVRVHYFDFLSAAEEKGQRGEGYDRDLAQFREFHVGMATQHGYYLSYGDFIHPDRKEWVAMPTDAAGGVPMSLARMRARVEATRRAGARAAIYMHYTILDEGSPLFEKMRDSVLVDAGGKPALFGWEGPDVIKTTWKMSHTSPQWRDHLVQQAQWIMELLDPDAIVLDETFTAWGWDHHKSHGGPLSQGGIELMRRLRQTVRSFGPEKALFASDCSMANFCLWGDGEGGDHCYDRLLGHELYRKPPVRYLAALGPKAWLPCAWLYKSLWSDQVDLARKTGAALGVTNGWGDGFGLARLPEDSKRQMRRDIASLVRE